jgi:flagellar basal-body rod protein FlgG
MQAQTLNIDVIANNLANVSTTSFKRSRADFQDLLYSTIRPPGVSSSETTTVPTGIQIGHGIKPVAVTKSFLQGELNHTGNDLDVAIEGDGFFQVLRPDGDTAYTRAGDFKLDQDGRLVTPDGFPMQPEISVPSDTVAISIGTDGIVSVMQAGSTQATDIGVIELADFVNPSGLKSLGRNLYLPTTASGDAVTGTAGLDGFGTIAQGFLETSNVKVVDEMVNMITAQRAYEVNSKVIQTTDEMLQVANGLKR